MLLSAIFNHFKAYFNKNKNTEKNKNKYALFDGGFYIRKVANIFKRFIRLLRKLHLTRKKLKVSYYKRNNLISFFLHLNTLFFLFFIFINNFGVYRNMYRAFKVFY